MITANSRYANSSVVTNTVAGQPASVITPGLQSAYSFTYISHAYTDLDRLDLLANRYFGDATQWWRIADANPEIINPGSIVPGTILRIPLS